jgi:hypothetical protein
LRLWTARDPTIDWSGAGLIADLSIQCRGRGTFLYLFNGHLHGFFLFFLRYGDLFISLRDGFHTLRDFLLLRYTFFYDRVVSNGGVFRRFSRGSGGGGRYGNSSGPSYIDDFFFRGLTLGGSTPQTQDQSTHQQEHQISHIYLISA